MKKTKDRLPYISEKETKTKNSESNGEQNLENRLDDQMEGEIRTNH